MKNNRRNRIILTLVGMCLIICYMVFGIYILMTIGSCICIMSVIMKHMEESRDVKDKNRSD